MRRMREISPFFHTRVTLPDGVELRLRAIRPSDRTTLRTEFLRLSPDSVRNRFLNAKRSLSDKELGFLTEVDFTMHVALMAEVEHNGLMRSIGVGRFVRESASPERAEFAITVIDEWQGRGVGKALLRQLIECARQLGVRQFDGMLFADNRPMLHLLHHVGLPLQVESDAGIDSVSLQLQA